MSSVTSPSYLALTKHNAPPTQSEAHIVRERILDLTRQQRHLAQIFTKAQEQLQENTALLVSLSAILAPIRRLPLEILGEIFLQIPTSKFRPRNHQKTILRVSLVCKSWRDAARLTARLWCDIWVKADAPSITFDSIVAWTNRAGSVAKSIEISSSRCGVDWSNCNQNVCAGPRHCLFANPAFAAALAHAPGTWRSVSLNCPTLSCFAKLAASITEAAQEPSANGWNSIQALDIVASNWPGWQLPVTPPLFSFIPSTVKTFRLFLPRQPFDDRDLNQGNLWESIWTNPLSIPSALLNGLTSLELAFSYTIIDPSPIFVALEQCQNLEALDLDLSCATLIVTDHQPEPFLRPYVLLPKLRTLRLRQIPRDPSCLNLLDKLRAPNVVDISLSFGIDKLVDRHYYGPMGSFGVRSDDETERQRGDYDVEHLTNFIRCDQSSPSQLQKLHIKSGSFFDGALCHLLRDLDSLKELKLEWLSLWSHDSDDFLSLTICKPPCLQQLKTIEVSNLKYPTEREIPFLRYFAEERGINLKLSLHDREAWEEDEKRYLYLVGMDSDSEWDDD